MVDAGELVPIGRHSLEPEIDHPGLREADEKERSPVGKKLPEIDNRPGFTSLRGELPRMRSPDDQVDSLRDRGCEIGECDVSGVEVIGQSAPRPGTPCAEPRIRRGVTPSKIHHLNTSPCGRSGSDMEATHDLRNISPTPQGRN